MTEKSVYKSTTMGDIPLSFTGRHLLQTLREEIQDYVEQFRNRQPHERSWDGLSKARGKLAKYMSDLEKKAEKFFLRDVPQIDLDMELARRGFTVNKKLPPWHRKPVEDSVNELLDAGYAVSVTADYRQPPGSFNVRVDGVVNSDQAQRIGQHMTKDWERKQGLAKERMNLNYRFRNPNKSPIPPGNHSFEIVEILEIKTDDIAVSDYIAKPRPPHQYIRELTFGARGAKAARELAVKKFSAQGFNDLEFDVYVKIRD